MFVKTWTTASTQSKTVLKYHQKFNNTVNYIYNIYYKIENDKNMKEIIYFYKTIILILLLKLKWIEMWINNISIIY